MNLLKDIIKRHFNVNYPSSTEIILRELENTGFPNRYENFKQELISAIKNNTLMPDELESLTDDEFENQEEVETYLKNIVWKTIYTDPVP